MHITGADENGAQPNSRRGSKGTKRSRPSGVYVAGSRQHQVHKLVCACVNVRCQLCISAAVEEDGAAQPV